MKTQLKLAALSLTLITLNLAPATAFAQGDLTPLEAPTPTMKTLDQLWDALQTTQAQVTQMQRMQSSQYNSVSLPITMTVDSGGMVGQYTSLAFTPTGRPAISYLDMSNADLKFTVRLGGTWIASTVDTLGGVG